MSNIKIKHNLYTAYALTGPKASQCDIIFTSANMNVRKHGRFCQNRNSWMHSRPNFLGHIASSFLTLQANCFATGLLCYRNFCDQLGDTLRALSGCIVTEFSHSRSYVATKLSGYGVVDDMLTNLKVASRFNCCSGLGGKLNLNCNQI